MGFEYDPSLAAIIGAVASQEVIKSVTKENRPVNGLFWINAQNIEGRILILS